MKPYFTDGKAIILYHGMCEELLPEILVVEKPAVCITDPPYIAAADGGGLSKKRMDFKKIVGKIDGGFKMELLDQFENWICFCGKQQLRQLIDKADDSKSSWMLITCFKKAVSPLVNNNYMPDVEYAVHKWMPGRLFGECKDKSRIVNFPREFEFTHPTVKPLSVMSKLINLGSQIGDLIIDPFCGTGSTLVAAKALKRRAIGIEKEEQWCEVAARRLEQENLF